MSSIISKRFALAIRPMNSELKVKASKELAKMVEEELNDDTEELDVKELLKKNEIKKTK